MPVVIDEVVTESPAKAALGNEAPAEAPAAPPAHEIERILDEQRARLARVRAH